MDGERNVFVIDDYNDCVRVFSSATGQTLTTLGARGSALDQLDGMRAGIAIDAAGRLYVSDSRNDRVVVFE